MKLKPLVSLVLDPCEATDEAEGGRAIAGAALGAGTGAATDLGRLKDARKSSSSI